MGEMAGHDITEKTQTSLLHTGFFPIPSALRIPPATSVPKSTMLIFGGYLTGLYRAQYCHDNMPLIPVHLFASTFGSKRALLVTLFIFVETDYFFSGNC